MDSSAPHGRSEMSGEIASRYWEGMDRSMPGKLALMSALLHLDKGATVVDAGCGSGSAAYHLARLNPGIRVIGIDLDPAAVEACRKRHRQANLSFEVGDISMPLAEKVDAILSSSTLHHVFAFQQPAYSTANVERALANHAASLKDGGVLALRDFVMPTDPDRPVVLSLKDEGRRTGSFTEIDEPTLLERFAAGARPRAQSPGFPLLELSPRDGMRRFSLRLGDATEFLLRKDYRQDWEAELQEQYGYFTGAGFIEAFARAGFADSREIPVHNHWIIGKRWADRVRLETESGATLTWPATNILVAGRKIASGGRRIRWQRTMPPKGYLRTLHSKAPDGHVWTVAQRPHDAIEIIPYVADGESVRILARDGHARPLATAYASRHPGRTIEPIAFAGNGQQGIGDALQRLGIDPALVAGNETRLLEYLPSAGGIAERAVSHAIALKQMPERRAVRVDALSRGTILRSFDAIDILRAGQAGALDEARLEIDVATLLRSRRAPLGEWVVEKLAPAADPRPIADGPRPAGDFAAADVAPAQPWMSIRRGLFQDLDGEGAVLAATELEWAEPSDAFPATGSILPLRQHLDRLYFGIEWRILPAAKLLLGSGALPCVPAWRLRERPHSMLEAMAPTLAASGFARARLVPLGGPYFASLGIASERVFPFVCDAADLSDAEVARFSWMPAEEFLSRIGELRDGHLLVSGLRAAHMLGL